MGVTLALLENIDPDGLFEYSVVFTDRSLNHMSRNFQDVMQSLSKNLKQVYGASDVALVPGGGTFGMEAIARQFANDERVAIIRNGWFSFRWSQILKRGKITSDVSVLQAIQTFDNYQAPFKPVALDIIVNMIEDKKPAVVFAPHVETSAGVILPNEYLKSISKACHENGGIFVLDCVASGAAWVDMKATGVDVLLTAPQKGWSSSPCAGVIMFSERAVEKLHVTESSSFSCDLKKWFDIMKAYENNGHAYHATMPTDALVQFERTVLETKEFGFKAATENQIYIGQKIRSILENQGFKSVAAEGFKASSVIVSYTENDNFQNGKIFAEHGMQIAAGVPLECGEGKEFKTFRLGLFGLDKLQNPDRTILNFQNVLDKVA
jgi:aspartate aminotransferase-like enzyme